VKQIEIRVFSHTHLYSGNTTMSEPDQIEIAPIRIRRFIWVLAICWTIAMATTLTWELIDERNQAANIAWNKALGAWEKEMAIRLWDASNGGIYVPVSDKVLPDPYLAQSPDRDITTTSGRKLTLVGPAAIVRDIGKISDKQVEVQSHISSTTPIAPGNEPDPWEKKSLAEFAKGLPEARTMESLDGESYLRYMRPLFTEESCLQCHEEQNRKVGQLRGGLSVSVPMSIVWPLERAEMIHRILGYGGMWIFGLFGIALMSKQLKHQVERRFAAERELQQTNIMLEQRVKERTADIEEANRLMQSEIADRKQAETWLMESEQRFRSFFEQGLVGMAILSENLEWVEVNQRLCKMLGYTETELFLINWKDLTHAEDWPAEEARFQQMMDQLVKGYVMEKRFIRKDKKIIPANLSVQCMRRENGSIDCILVLVQEIQST
jgi:PAS domain S-box-containing protein